jgi:hypothetical protein
VITGETFRASELVINTFGSWPNCSLVLSRTNSYQLFF